MSKRQFEEKALWYTVGPSSIGKEMDLFVNGATGVRLTFSYGTPDIQYERAICIKEAAQQVERPCYIVADLAGEKFRLGTFQGEPTIPVKAGTTIRLIPTDTTAPSSENAVLPVPSIYFEAFAAQLKKGDVVTIGDGGAVFVVSQVSSEEIIAEIMMDGTIDQKRGLTIQGANFRPISLTSKDIQDLQHILSCSIYDAVAVSFVSSADDVVKVKKIAQNANRDIPIVAKIETMAGVENIKEICQHADIVMAARGDLALAMPWIELPGAVEQIVSAARSTSTPWIQATQIAEGLQRFTIPTRAEICDLAHWLKEMCSGVLLSYETAFGAHPIAAVKCTAALISRWGQRDEE